MVIFDNEAEAVKVVDWIRKYAGVETEVLKVG